MTKPQVSPVHLLLGVAAIACWSVFQMTLGEAIRVNQGLGFDGLLYGWLSFDFWGTVVDHGLTAERAGRILPSVIVGTSLRVVGVEVTPQSVFTAFRVLTIVMVVGVAVLWWAICRHVRLGVGAYWLGYLALFVNFMVLRQMFYVPVGTDAVTFFLATLLAYGFARRSQICMLLAAAPALYTAPTLSYFAIPLLLIPRGGGEVSDVPFEGRRRQSAQLFTLMCASLLAGLSVYLLYGKALVPAQFVESVPPWRAAMPLSIAALAGFVTVGFWFLARAATTLRFRAAAKAISPLGAVALLVFIVAAQQSYAAMATDPSGKSLLELLTGDLGVIVRGTNAPFCFIVAHFAYFGPTVAMVLLTFPRMVGEARRRSPLALVALLTLLFMSLTSESRHLLVMYPLVVFLIVASLDFSTIRPAAIVGFGIMAALWSKAWLPLNAADEADQIPTTSYFLHFGPWMPHEVYGWFLAAAVVTVILFLWLFRTGGTPSPAPQAPSPQD